MQCPKDRRTELTTSTLMGQLTAHHCPDCQGNWITGVDYATWQARQSVPEDVPSLIDRALEVDRENSPYDAKAALCPECNAYLARAKVSLKTPFYVERCTNCKGIWCDRDEWDWLMKLQFHTLIEYMFSNDWQVRTREREQLAQERRATIDKLGPTLAARVFELADVLAQHPNGDFGVAYLMRRFDQ